MPATPLKVTSLLWSRGKGELTKDLSKSRYQIYRLAMKMPQSVLAIVSVTDRPIVGKGSLVEVVLCHPRKNATPDIQTEYDLASLGEVESIHGPFCDPPRWMVSYKGKVSAEKGDSIRQKD
jgi:hypothetical protein